MNGIGRPTPSSRAIQALSPRRSSTWPAREQLRPTRCARSPITPTTGGQPAGIWRSVDPGHVGYQSARRACFSTRAPGSGAGSHPAASKTPRVTAANLKRGVTARLASPLKIVVHRLHRHSAGYTIFHTVSSWSRRSVSSSCYSRDLCPVAQSRFRAREARFPLVIALVRDPRCSHRLATTAHGSAYRNWNGHNGFRTGSVRYPAGITRRAKYPPTPVNADGGVAPAVRDLK